MKKLFFVIAVAICLIGCAVPGTYMAGNAYTNSLRDRLLRSTLIQIDSNSVQKGYLCEELSTDYRYHIGPYDQLNVVVWNHPELTLPSSAIAATNLSNNYASFKPGSGDSLLFSQTNSQLTGVFVDANGNVVFPLVGNIKVSGLTTYQAQNLFAQKLSDYIRNPKVSVQITAFNSQRVNVIGEVAMQGSRALTDRPLTILDAINLSGGIKSDSANAGKIYVIRGGIDKDIKVFWLNATSPQSLLLAQRFHLANNDIVYVAPAGVTTWARVVNQVLPAATVVYYTWSMVKNS